MDRGLLSTYLSPHLSETNGEACEEWCIKTNKKKERKKRNQYLKSITNPVNKSPTHRAHSHHNARTSGAQSFLSPRVCFHGKRLHSQEGLVGPLKGTDIPWSLETMVRGKSEPNLERGKSCQPMSCLCLSRAGSSEDWSEEGQQSWWGLRMCSTYECLTSVWALNSWPAECREPQARSPVNGAAFPRLRVTATEKDAGQKSQGSPWWSDHQLSGGVHTRKRTVTWRPHRYLSTADATKRVTSC